MSATDDRVRAKARTAPGCHGGRPHDLRHFFASLLIPPGLSVTVVSARSGHGDATLTLNTYAHPRPDDQDRSREAIESELGRGHVPHLRPAVEG